MQEPRYHLPAAAAATFAELIVQIAAATETKAALQVGDHPAFVRWII
jgi:hypothetical protein